VERGERREESGGKDLRRYEARARTKRTTVQRAVGNEQGRERREGTMCV
jgi:hypothetical protein